MRLKATAAAGLVAMLVLAGCGDDGDAETAETPDTAATVEESPSETAEPTEEPTEEATEEAGTIVDVAAGNPDFSTLVAAVEAAGLAETLSGPGPFTVFAPTNEAFEALPPGVLDALLLPENSALLTQVLTYHVLAAEVPSSDVTDGEVATVQGEAVTLSTATGVTVNDATVIIPDVEASNGVIHAIDAVLVPPSVDVSTLVS
ncbi:MAG TPA: fasciclin domain-containing protein [Jiangellales bacterium]|nr:fasciclin domain-containing protein [Jiangellales bacterium]